MKKYVRVMADYCAGGLWEHDGSMMIESELGLPDDLLLRLDTWQIWYSNDCQDYRDPEDRTKEFDIGAFSIEGEAIAKEIKSFLGDDWTVIYHSEKRSAEYLRELEKYRNYVEYEINGY